ncbi:MAG: bifunctional folylpolyglutamate synthase/dihydrofolate synthase [Rhodospirillales bacterium]|nr:MAG: bifunctional folylpolyglutamate synthase/dihydrofolate synthase [Rhodospirillales bacterium]
MTSVPSDAVLARLERLHPRVIDLSLDRVLRLLHRLGDPHTALPPVIHIAGTNGKGSVAAFMRAMLEATGRRVHVFTSPHLVRFHERIVLAGREIEEPALVALLERCEHANAGEAITFFEITTAAAFLAFAETAADVTVLETGLGGRLDATNVVTRPAATVITPIALDHQAFLGDRLAAIAAEKAGILKPGVPCAVAAQPAEAAATIMDRARALAVPTRWEGRDWMVAATTDGMHWQRAGRTLALPRPSLPGRHQVSNAGVAVACLDMLPALEVSPAAIARGLSRAVWPGRLQRLDTGNLHRLLPESWELWLDGAHNPAAAAALADVLSGWRLAGPDRPVHVVAGILQSKDPGRFLGHLAGHVASVVAVPVAGSAAGLPPDAVCRAAAQAGIPAVVAPGLEDGLRHLPVTHPAPARVLVTGSLYLVGEALRRNDAATSEAAA